MQPFWLRDYWLRKRISSQGGCWLIVIWLRINSTRPLRFWRIANRTQTDINSQWAAWRRTSSRMGRKPSWEPRQIRIPRVTMRFQTGALAYTFSESSLKRTIVITRQKTIFIGPLRWIRLSGRPIKNWGSWARMSFPTRFSQTSGWRAMRFITKKPYCPHPVPSISVLRDNKAKSSRKDTPQWEQFPFFAGKVQHRQMSLPSQVTLRLV